MLAPLGETMIQKLIDFLVRYFANGATLLRQGAWVATGQLLSGIGALVAIRITTELLTTSQFGLFALLVGIAGLALGIVSNPVLQAVLRFYPDWARLGRLGEFRSTAALMFRLRAAAAVTSIALGGLIFSLVMGHSWISAPLVAALLAIDCFRSFELVLMNAASRQRSVAFIYAADAWARPLGAVLAVTVFGASAEAALGGYVAGAAAAAALTLATMDLEGCDAVSHPAAALNLKNDPALRGLLGHYALPLVPLGLFSWISSVGDRYFIGGLLGLDEAGLYAAAYGLASRPFLMVFSMIELTLRPVLQNAIADADLKRIADAKLAFILSTNAAAVLGVLGFVLLSDWVAGLFLAPHFRNAVHLMPWIALGYGLYILSSVFTRFCYAFDDTRGVLALTVVGAVLGIAIMVPSIAAFGLNGASGAVVVSFGVQLVVSFLLSRRAQARFFKVHAVRREAQPDLPLVASQTALSSGPKENANGA